MTAVLQLQPATIPADKHTFTAMHLYPDSPALQVKMEEFLGKSLFLTCTIHFLLGFVFPGLVATGIIASVLWTLPALLGAGSYPGTQGAGAPGLSHLLAPA